VTSSPQRGLPPRLYVPIVLLFGAVFVGLVVILMRQGLSTGGSVFGAGTGAQARVAPQSAPPPAVSVEGGGPPAGVRMQLQELRDRVARNPKDDVALTQLGDMYLAAGMYAQAVPYYHRALAVNSSNVAAREGLSQALTGEKGSP
jgi:cytochrome c-type biogenesis protein CcmH/NrfG